MKPSLASDTVKGALFLLSAAFLYSLMPVMIRFLGSGGIPPISQVFLRYIFAFLAALAYFTFTNKAAIPSVKQNVLPLAVATIFGYALTNVFFTVGILNTQVSTALFLLYSYAVITPVAGFIFLRDKINRYNLTALVVSLVALFLLFQPTPFPTWKIGAVFAILAALGQTVYVILRRVLKAYPANFLMLASTTMGVVVVGLLSFAFEGQFYLGPISRLSPNTWLVTVIFGLDNFFGWLAMTKGFEHFKAASGSLILLSELVFGVLFALAFFGEVPAFATLLGGFLIIFSSALVILRGES